MAICFLSLFVTVVFHGPRAYGWGDLGHEVVGAIAEGALKPATHNFVRGILGVEPLAVAATWPDHARGDSRFGQKATSPDSEDNNPHNFANYHFCEIPNGFSYTSKPMREKKDCYGAITGATQLLIDKSHQYTRAEKMIALRYLVHIIGDVHQPLHVGNGHDLGANLCQILPYETATLPGIALHAFWDVNMVVALGRSFETSKGPKKSDIYYNDLLPRLRKDHPEMFAADAKQKFGTGTPLDWLNESKALRESGLYPDRVGAMNNVPKGEEYMHRPYCKWITSPSNTKAVLGTIDSSQIPVMSKDYVSRWVPVVETQLLKAGLRLAVALDAIADQATDALADPIRMDDGTEETVLETVQKSFENADPVKK
jgi:hypothetical protein